MREKSNQTHFFWEIQRRGLKPYQTNLNEAEIWQASISEVGDSMGKIALLFFIFILSEIRSLWMAWSLELKFFAYPLVLLTLV